MSNSAFAERVLFLTMFDLRLQVLPEPPIVAEPGTFRHGHLVRLTVAFRSVHVKGNENGSRKFEIVLRGMSLISRAGALVSVRQCLYE